MKPRDFHIGMMRSIVKFEANTPTDTNDGGEEEFYTEFLTTRGYLKKRNGYRSLEQGDMVLNSGYSMICRFQTALENQLNTDVRIVMDNNRVFRIESWEVYDEIKHLYKFDLNEGQLQ